MCVWVCLSACVRVCVHVDTSPPVCEPGVEAESLRHTESRYARAPLLRTSARSDGVGIHLIHFKAFRRALNGVVV